jgi:hypothetical protein
MKSNVAAAMAETRLMLIDKRCLDDFCVSKEYSFYRQVLTTNQRVASSNLAECININLINRIVYEEKDKP